jgi:P4 family phage/plasmid primase-like protien
MVEYLNTVKSNKQTTNKHLQELGPPLYQLTQYGMGFENYLSNIKSISDVKKIIDKLFHDNALRGDDYKIKETHDMTMILPESYYNPYEKWIRVGWALKNTDFRLFFTWILFSSKSSSFDINDIQQRYVDWCNFKEGPECLSYKSVSLWAKSYYDQLCKNNRNEQNLYKMVVENTVEYYLTQSIASGGADFDLAMVMYQRYKDDFKCAQSSKNVWYQFENHRWLEIEGSVILKRLYSTNLYKLYNAKTIEILNKMNALDKTDNEYDNYEKLLANVSKICQKLKDSNKKTGLYNAAKELFYDSNFVHMIDKNPDLMVFKNGVIDFKKKEFRNGYAEDYLTLTTGIDYKPLSHYMEKSPEIIEDINAFMETLFPIHDVNKYMKEFLASTLIGTNLNHKFRIFLGSGSNGKSILIKLMSKILGPYQGILPGQVITQKRIGVGNATPEIMSLMGTRLAVIQEPSRGEKLNDGPMKELTGGDPITGRKLYHDTVTFDPQFDLAVCANNLYDIDDTSEGTWRRIDLIPFVSKFVDDVSDPQHSNHKYVFPKDKFLDKKFDLWKETFISMLVDIVFKTNGIVEPCETIKNYSYEYETNQNSVLKFIRTCIKESEGSNVKISGLWRDYQLWMQMQGNTKLLKRGDLQEKMNKLYGDYKKYKCWKNIKVVISEENEEEEEEEILE